MESRGPTDAELENWAQFVVAEARMMRHAAARYSAIRKDDASLSTGTAETQRRTEENALVVAFLTHYRNLVNFLSPPKQPRRSAVTAGLYLGLDRFHRMSAPTMHRSKINERVSHISKFRATLEPADKPWPLGEMLRELEAAWEGFLVELAEQFHDRVAWFRTLPIDAVDQPPLPYKVQWGVSATTSPMPEVQIDYFDPDDDEQS
ncbi:MAG: hypothetical protein KQH83_09255 [Actinobacteria bacterium]|nr:hypothetical protein [Actinomycetota bacterium]